MDWSLPPLEAERQGGSSQSWRARGIFHQTVSRLPVANQVSLGSWVVDICQEVHSQRSAPQRRHTANLRWRSGGAPRKPSLWDWGGDKMHCIPGRARSQSTWSLELLGPGKGAKHRPNLCLCGVPENLNLSGSDPGSACNPGLALDTSPAEQPGA